MLLPSSAKDIVTCAKDIVDVCMASKASRDSYYRNLITWLEQGKGEGDRSLCNVLYHHCDRLSAHLFSPTELRFTIDFDTPYDAMILAQGELSSRLISRTWEQQNIDMDFSRGVASAVPYGAAILKQQWDGSSAAVTSRLLMPWQFGVYREDLNGLKEQEALCEVSLMTRHEAWRRISHLPDAEKLMKRIIAHAATDGGANEVGPASFFHQILSTSTLDTSGTTNASLRPGGIVTMGNPSFVIQPQVDISLIKYYEIWVKDEEIDDYCTIQLIEPDILIAPFGRRKNLLCRTFTDIARGAGVSMSLKQHPYTLIQPNVQPGYFWGRSELTDLLGPQELLTTLLFDIKRVMGVQFDKLLAFVGADGMSDEQYAQYRGSGYFNLPQGSSVTDLTPKLPEASFQYMTMINKLMEQISGFDNILSGQGEAGVRAGVHADTLIRTASPRLRDRSLLVERQCAEAADKTLTLMRIYDGTVYNTNDPKAPSDFSIELLPEDAKVTVDSHSSSPIYEQDHKDLIGFGVKAGIVDGESAIDLLPFPKKDQLKLRFREAQAQKAKMIQEHPELLAKRGHK